jgi:CubicO group peptidase (beta-lactamase class C family)
MIRPILAKACLCALLVCLGTMLIRPASGAHAPKISAHTPRSRDTFDAKRFGAFVDSVMNAEMKREGIPGAAFVFVRHGRVVYQKGYGWADVPARRAVDPERTIWRIGSISKTFTATAVMQLADRGRIHREADVNLYLSKVKVPETYPLPVTVTDLLTLSAGVAEIRPGTHGPSRESVQPLSEFLAPRLVRVRPPGQTISYSTYGITLAGDLVEEVSGEPIEEYLAENIWRPLGMNRTSIDVPASLGGDVAMGYERRGDSLEAQAWEWYHTTPASSINSTAADMARYLMAHLGHGRIGSARVLSEKASTEMLSQQVRMHPKVPGVTLGFWEGQFGDLRVVEHGGNVAGFSAQLVMIPSEDAGFFVVNQFENSKLRDNLEDALLQHLYPRARVRPIPPAPPPDFRRRGDAYAGNYGPITSCHSCKPRSVPFVLEVKNEGDALRISNFRYVEVAPLLFLREDGGAYVAFRADASGAIVEMHPGSFWAFERLPKE